MLTVYIGDYSCIIVILLLLLPKLEGNCINTSLGRKPHTSQSRQSQIETPTFYQYKSVCLITADYPQIYIIVPDALPPIHAESYRVATDRDPSK